MSLWRGPPAGDNPWGATTLEWQAPQSSADRGTTAFAEAMAVKEVPRYMYERRPDTNTTSIRLGTWLFLASEAMFFGSLFSAYVLLRAGGSPSHVVAACLHVLARWCIWCMPLGASWSPRGCDGIVEATRHTTRRAAVCAPAILVVHDPHRSSDSRGLPPRLSDRD